MSKRRKYELRYFFQNARLWSGVPVRVRQADYDKAWPGITPVTSQGYPMVMRLFTPDGPFLPVTRMVRYSTSPSLHSCDERCIQAKGEVLTCQCVCGGINHGTGTF